MNQKFQKFGNSSRWYRNFQEKFPKLLNFRNVNNSVENLRNSGSKVEWKENFQEKVSQNLGIPRQVLLSLEILENAVPLSPGSCRNSNRTFWLNGKHPNSPLLFPCTSYTYTCRIIEDGSYKIHDGRSRP